MLLEVSGMPETIQKRSNEEGNYIFNILFLRNHRFQPAKNNHRWLPE